jgi:hypothetical protein
MRYTKQHLTGSTARGYTFISKRYITASFLSRPKPAKLPARALPRRRR